MSQQGHIFIVDDTKDGRLFLKMMLEDEYEITEIESGEACLEAIKNNKPDLILLDVEMPGMNGYQVCTHLRQQEETQYIPVIFVSALDSPEERLDGFEAGGDDYLIKPVDEDDLLDIISKSLKRQSDISQTQQQATSATSMAMEAMTVSSELGQIINFVKEVQSLNTPEELGKAILEIVEDFCLNSAVMINTGVPVFIGCNTGSLESRLLIQVANSGERIFSVGIRTVVKNDYLALLIKDMPIDDENRYGRLKDHLAVLMDIANGHLATLVAKNTVLHQRKELLNQIISVAEKQIQKTSEKINTHQQNSYQIMQGMLSSLENMLFKLGLDDDQEEQLMQLANNTSLKLEDASHDTKELATELGVILEKLYEFMQK